MTGHDWLVGGGAVAAIFLAVQALKAKFPKALDGREEIVALLLGLVAGVGARLLKPDGWQSGYLGWAAAVGSGLAAALASGIFHDKAANPFVAVIQAVFGKPQFIGGPTPVQGVPAVPAPTPGEEKP